LPEIIGHVDERDRPLVRFSVPGQDDSVLALIDTGFNGYLFVHQDIAVRLGFAKTGLVSEAEFADQGLHEVSLARGRMAWFGEVVTVDVLVAPDRLPRATHSDEPVALLGTSLLSPHQLTVDFANRTVVIAQSGE
jgi:predicted aspartyl protease